MYRDDIFLLFIVVGDPIIFTPSRVLLKEGWIERVKNVNGRIDIKFYYAHLFNDAFIYSSCNHSSNAFKLNKAIDLKSAVLNICDDYDHEKGFFYFTSNKKDSIKQQEYILLRLSKIEKQSDEDLFSEWMLAIQEQIDALKIKKLANKRISALDTIKYNHKSITVDSKKLGSRAQIIYHFLCHAFNYTDMMTMMNITLIQPLISASRGGSLHAIQIKDNLIITDNSSNALFDSRTFSDNNYINYFDTKSIISNAIIETTTSITNYNNNNASNNISIIKDILQDSEIIIFLRSFESITIMLKEFCNSLEGICLSSDWDDDNLSIGIFFQSLSAISLYNQLKIFTDSKHAFDRTLSMSNFVLFYHDAENYLSSLPGNLEYKLDLTTQYMNEIYKFLLELNKKTNNNHADKISLTIAIDKVNIINNEIKEMIRIRTNYKELMKIQSSFILTTDPFVNKLNNKNRIIIKIGELKKVCRKKNKIFRFWLFNDYLIYASPLGGDKYKFNRALELSTTSAKNHVGHDYLYAIDIHSSEKSFVIIATSEVIQQEWINAIQSTKASLLGISIAELNKMEMSSTNNESAPLWVQDNANGCNVCHKVCQYDCIHTIYMFIHIYMFTHIQIIIL